MRGWANLNPRQRGLALALVLSLLATLVLALQPEEADTQDLQAVVPQRAPTATPAATEQPQGALAQRKAWATPAAAQLLAWSPPAPPPAPPEPTPVAAAAPAPSAPPFPYQLIGRLSEGEEADAVALLAGATRTVAVRRGEVLDAQWRVDQVQAQTLKLTWLPAQLPVSIAFKAAP